MKKEKPTELVRVSYLGRECFVQLCYNKGSQITLLNPQCTPIVCESRQSERPIRIGSVLGEKFEIIPKQMVYLNQEHQIEGILVNRMVLPTVTINSKFNESIQWAMGCSARYFTWWTSSA